MFILRILIYVITENNHANGECSHVENIQNITFREKISNNTRKLYIKINLYYVKIDT